MRTDRNHGPNRPVTLRLALPERVAAWLERHAVDEREMREIAVSILEMVVEDDEAAHGGTMH
jgi:hypothetical protein